MGPFNRLPEIADTARVAHQLGNSAVVVERHYRQSTRPQIAAEWFAIRRQIACRGLASDAGGDVNLPMAQMCVKMAQNRVDKLSCAF